MRGTQRLGWMALAIFGIGLGIYGLRPTASVAQAPAAMTSGPKYTVVETDGTNMLVVDNSTNVMHFYTIDQDKQVGAELKLRGSIDLNQVGKPIILPKVHHKPE